MKYYSEILNKNFDKVEDLEKAEKEHADAIKAKEDAKALVKKEAEVVEEAFKARNEARLEYNKKLVEARKAYNEKITLAKKDFEACLSEMSGALEAAEKDYDAKLKEFQKNHPEGYHITLKDGDNVVTLTSSNFPTFKQLDQEFNDMLDLFGNLLRRW